MCACRFLSSNRSQLTSIQLWDVLEDYIRLCGPATGNPLMPDRTQTTWRKPAAEYVDVAALAEKQIQALAQECL